MECDSVGKTNLTALITGVTGNIGSVTSELLLENDWFVHGISRSISYSEDDAHLYEPFDLNVSWDKIRLWQHSNRMKYDLVVFAHGVQRPRSGHEMNEDDWNYICSGNLTSAIGLTQVLIKENKLDDGALIVYCSSIQANTPRAGRGLYGAAKAGLEAFSKAIAVELAPQGVRTVAIRLGQLTETMGGIMFSEDEKERLKRRALLPWIDPLDVAAFINDLYWIRGLTGSVISFDSGHGINVW